MIATPTLTISVNPLTVIPAALAAGAGVYVGFRAAQMAEEAAMSAVDRIKAKMSAKKAEKKNETK